MATKLLTPSNLKSIRFELSGLDEYAKAVQVAGNKVDEAIADAIEEIKEGIKDDIDSWAKEHENSGAVMRSVDATEVKQDGNYIYSDVGINSDKDYLGWHAVFVEYGTPRMPADPGIRNAFEWWRRKSKKIYKKHLEKRGVPIE